MELKINREMIPVTETILDDVQEQSVELDYVLPDYDPDIFRIIGCEMHPTIVSYTTASDRITYELRVDIRILYCGAGSTLLQCVSQQMMFSRSAELPRTAENPTLTLRPRITYSNCRAVSPRRLEARGAVSVQIRVTGDRRQEVIRDVFGMHVQLRKIPVEYAAQKRSAVKNITLSEEVELGAAKPPIRSIVRNNVRLVHQETSILAGKLIVKGDAEVQLLYTWQKDDGSGGMESMQFTLPYSQIVDMEQIDESYRSSAEAQVIRCDLKPSAEVLQCEIDRHSDGIGSAGHRCVLHLLPLPADTGFRADRHGTGAGVQFHGMQCRHSPRRPHSGMHLRPPVSGAQHQHAAALRHQPHSCQRHALL